VLRPRLAAAGPPNCRRCGLARRHRAPGGRRQPLRSLRGDPRRAQRDRRRQPPPDVRGLYRFYEELALRFAERGVDAVAIDYFGRTAGAAKRGDDFDNSPHVAQTTQEGIQADVRAAVERLRPRTRAIFAVGFCFGGRNSWLAAASGHGLAGAVGFYGNPGERDGAPGPTQRAAELEAPILALQAGADQNITAEMNEAFDRALKNAGVEYELVTYEGAPHSFFDRRYEEFAEASEDAWRRVLEFLETHSA
jgi:carboxymethylenebutenolidase